MNRRHRGSALLIVLVLVLLVEGFVAVMLTAANTRTRLVGDQHWAIEGELVAESALAEGRLHFATAAGLLEGIPQRIDGVRPDGWSWSVEATRYGDLVRLSATAQRLRVGSPPIAGARLTLLLSRLPSDTLQRLPIHPRF